MNLFSFTTDRQEKEREKKFPKNQLGVGLKLVAIVGLGSGTRETVGLWLTARSPRPVRRYNESCRSRETLFSFRPSRASPIV
jgi:hypothetical protein